MITPQFLSLFTVLFCFSFANAQVDYSGLKSTRISDQPLKIDQEWLKQARSKEQNQQCEEFVRFSHQDMNTYGLVVIQNGKTLLESYARGASQKNLFKLWSISKTVSGLLFGRLVQQNSELLDQPIWPRLGSAANNDLMQVQGDKFSRSELKFRDVWNMGSGLEWCEYSECAAIDPLKLLYGNGRSDGLRYVLSKPLIYQPGSVYQYSAGNYMVLHQAMREILGGQKTYDQLPSQFFSAIDVKDFAFEKDGKGLFVGGAGLSLSARGFAHLGQFILNRGKWNSKELLSPAFYQEMTTTSQVIRSSQTPQGVKNWEGPVGGSIWLNEKIPGVPQFFRHMPNDMIYGAGKFGQFLLIYPSANLVVARIGADYNHSPFWNPFAEKAVACFSPESLVSNPPQTDGENSSAKPPATDQITLARNVTELVAQNIITQSVAQETCSCHLVGKFPPQTCQKINPLPEILTRFVDFSIEKEKQNGLVLVHSQAKLRIDALRSLIGRIEQFSAAQQSEIRNLLQAVLSRTFPQQAGQLQKQSLPQLLELTLSKIDSIRLPRASSKFDPEKPQFGCQPTSNQAQ